MINTIEHVAQYLRQDVQSLGAVSQNVANQSTIGYRASRMLPDFASSLSHPMISLAQGPIAETGNPFDLALDGPGFFAVVDGQGLLLTRAGQFRRGADGQLVDAAARTVLGQNGPISLTSGRFTVEANGDIVQDGAVVDRLLLLTASQDTTLLPTTGGVRPLGSAIEAEPRVRQGALEGANVDPAQETIALIELSRHVESVQRALSIYDKAMELGINRLGEN